MKIKLSKSQWEFMGKKAGWMKKANDDVPASDLETYIGAIGKFINKCKGEGSSKEEFDKDFSFLWNDIALNFKYLDPTDKVELQNMHDSLYSQIFFSKFPRFPSRDNAISIFQNKDVISRAEDILGNMRRLLATKETL